MSAGLYSFVSREEEEEPTKKAPMFAEALARDFEEAGDTDIRQIHTVPMAKPPVRGPLPAREPPRTLLTPISMAVQIDAFRAVAANEVTIPKRTSGRSSVCRSVVTAVLAAAALVSLYALGPRAGLDAPPAPRVALVQAASRKLEAPHGKQRARRVYSTSLPAAAPLPPPPRR